MALLSHCPTTSLSHCLTVLPRNPPDPPSCFTQCRRLQFIIVGMNTHLQRQSIAAVVAAAGRSRRMGSPKQLLAWGDSTVIATVAQNLTAAGAAPVLCVVGHRQAEILEALAHTATQTVFNPNYIEGEMLSSYQAGIRTLGGTSCIGTLIALGDQPHIPVAIIRQALEQAQVTPHKLVIPSYNMRRGHPFYIPRQLWLELLALSGDETLRTLLMRHPDEIVYVNVDSAAILRDMDTPEEYAAVQGG